MEIEDLSKTTLLQLLGSTIADILGRRSSSKNTSEQSQPIANALWKGFQKNLCQYDFSTI